jgi:hypothetical protein
MKLKIHKINISRVFSFNIVALEEVKKKGVIMISQVYLCFTYKTHGFIFEIAK